ARGVVGCRRLDPGGRGRGIAERRHARRRARASVRPGAPRDGRRRDRGRRSSVRRDRRSGSLRGTRRLLRRRQALLGRPALRAIGGSRRPAGRRLAGTPRVDPGPARPVRARDGGLSGPRVDHDTRQRAGDQSVLARASRGLAVSSGKFQAPRGTHDVLPGEHLWWHVVRTMEEQATAYGWRRIQTPGFEDTGLFARTAGEASDVVNKEMYTFEDRSQRSLTLRPEGTAPIVRAYV